MMVLTGSLQYEIYLNGMSILNDGPGWKFAGWNQSERKMDFEG